ncbi:hypothetical protein [Bradyrhizobium ottawaense]|uniref:hypothetical protein n=1 Tax=Bradyrhizobium ottawaense TaxID=931866 RepID=UPI00383451A7
MLKQLWKKWTIDKPAAFGDLLWIVVVVQLAAFLDRLTLRRIIAIIPLVLLFVAYAHRIALPPEVMLVGDVLAYIDVFSVILLLSVMSRISAVWIFARQAAQHAIKLACKVLVAMRTFNFRRPREVITQGRLTGRSKIDDEHPAFAGFAWA